ncbi:hypothetical protein MMC07_005692 [Pseudocyphellaria aurata]|nr:hypothetical protein [Pseudocyphellaria aurata]
MLAMHVVGVQAETAQEQGKWRDAEPLLTEALAVDGTARLINTALWLGLCKARISLRRGGKETLHACEQAAEHDTENAEPLVLRCAGAGAAAGGRHGRGFARGHGSPLEVSQQPPGSAGAIPHPLLLVPLQSAAAFAASRLGCSGRASVPCIAAQPSHCQADGSLKLALDTAAAAGVHVVQEAEKARRMAERKDYYAILGVAQDADGREVKQAYRRRAQLYHPDKAAAAGIAKEEAERQFTDLAEAYEVPACGLTLPILRALCLDVDAARNARLHAGGLWLKRKGYAAAECTW